MGACSIMNCRDGVGGAPWPPTKDLNPHSMVRSHVSCPVERMGDNWGQGWDLNPRPSGYEPDELPTAPPCIIKGKGEKVKEKRNNQEATHHESFPYLMYIVYYKI